MPASYGQFCPVAKAMETLDERWTLLVVRELMSGSTHFNDLRRGLPRMSPALLAKRLRSLVRSGVVERTEEGNRVSYELSEAGRELEPIVKALGAWGIRWIADLGDEDLDPHLLMWDIHRNLAVEDLPEGRSVLHFEFTDIPAEARRWWIVVTDEGIDVCNADPGFDVLVEVRTGLRTLTLVWRGDLTWSAALASGDLQLSGDGPACRMLPTVLKLTPFAAVPRPRPVTSDSPAR